MHNNICYHCGANNGKKSIRFNEKHFCCNGCKIAYEILNQTDLCQYYDIKETPGNTPAEAGYKTKYNYLDDTDIFDQLIHFKNENAAKITFIIPSMHCASCVWILERLYKIKPEIINSRVDFLKKEFSI